MHTCTPFHNLIKQLSFSLSLSIFDSDKKKFHHCKASASLCIVSIILHISIRMHGMYMCLQKRSVIILRARNRVCATVYNFLCAWVSSLICNIPSSENKNYQKNRVQCTQYTHSHVNCNGNIFYLIQFFRNFFFIAQFKPSLLTLNTPDSICVV